MYTFLRNALDYVPRKVADDCLQELRWIYDRREITEVRRDTTGSTSTSRRR